MNVYFRKELCSNKFYFRDGTPAPFEKLAEGYGVLALDSEADKEKVENLRAAVKKGIGGVAEIDESEYEETKKKFGSPVSKRPQKGPKIFNPEDLNPVPKAPAPSLPGQAEAAKFVAAPESAKLVAGSESVTPAGEADSSLPKGLPTEPVSHGRKVNLHVGKPKEPSGQSSSEPTAQK